MNDEPSSDDPAQKTKTPEVISNNDIKSPKQQGRFKGLIFVLAFAFIGTAYLTYSYAATSDSNKEWSKGARGEVALDIIGDDLPEVAAKHNMSPGQLKKEFLADSTLEIDSEDNLLYVEPGMSDTEKKTVDENEKQSKKAADAQKAIDVAQVSAGTAQVAGAVAPTEAFNLSSDPSSTKTIYLDFDGHTTTGTQWNGSYGTTITSAPWDNDGNPGVYSDAERAIIINIWKAVSEDYAPFNINVTTKDPGVEALRKSSSTDTAYGKRVVISPTNWYSGGAGGVAYVGSFTSATDTPAFVFSGQLNSTTYKSQAAAAAHEAGHTLGLSHDGYLTDAYYMGQGDWAPIMGVSYYRKMSQWSKGEYTGATNKQDDLAIIAGYAGYVQDSVGDTTANAKSMTSSGTGFSETGVIDHTGDVDVYSFNWSGGGVTISGKTDADVTETSNPATDLDGSMQLLNSAGQQVALSDPGGALPVSVTMDLPAGAYYLELKGVGYLDPVSTGYSNYASLGSYTLGVASSTSTGGTTTPPPPPTNLPPVAKLTATPTTGTSPLNVIFSSAGSSDPEGKAITYSWNFGNGSTSTAANPSITYTTPGVYTVVLTVKDDVGLTSQASTSVTVKAPALTMSVSSITALAASSGRQKYALVTVVVTDQNGQAVSGATVTGNWTGLATGTSSAVTGSDGKVVIRSKNVRKSGNFTFTVTNVSITSGGSGI